MVAKKTEPCREGCPGYVHTGTSVKPCPRCYANQTRVYVKTCRIERCQRVFIARNITARYCTRSCRNHAQWHAVEKTITCAWCGKDFKSTRAIATVCSKECRHQDRLRWARNKWAENAEIRAKQKAQEDKAPKYPCATCKHGVQNKDAETNWMCGIGAFTYCKPYQPSPVYWVKRDTV